MQYIALEGFIKVLYERNILWVCTLIYIPILQPPRFMYHMIRLFYQPITLAILLAVHDKIKHCLICPSVEI